MAVVTLFIKHFHNPFHNEISYRTVTKEWIVLDQLAFLIYCHQILTWHINWIPQLNLKDTIMYTKSTNSWHFAFNKNVIFLPMGMLLSSFGMISLGLDLTGDPANGLCFLFRWVPWKRAHKFYISDQPRHRKFNGII